MLRSVLARNMAAHFAHPQLVMAIVCPGLLTWPVPMRMLDRGSWTSGGHHMEGQFGQRHIAHVGSKVACGDFRSPLIHPPTLTDRRGLIWASARCWTSCRWGQATYIQEAVLLHQLLGGLGEVYMVIFESADSVTRTRLLTHSGHAWGRH